MFSAFLLLTFLGDWVGVKVLSIFSDNTSESAEAASAEAASATPSTGEIVSVFWEIGLTVLPVTAAHFVWQLNNVTSTACIILACVTLLAIFLQNSKLVKLLSLRVPSGIALSNPAKDEPSLTAPVHLISDPFRAQFMWNASLYSKKSVRHKV
jgi:hypothetical protein